MAGTTWGAWAVVAVVVIGGSACGRDNGAPAATSSSEQVATTATTAGPTTAASAPGASTPADAVGAWVVGEGYAYAGDCATADMQRDIGKQCSTLRDDRGTSQVFEVGPTFSEYTTWVLVEQTAAGWVVTDSAPSPGGTPPPW